MSASDQVDRTILSDLVQFEEPRGKELSAQSKMGQSDSKNISNPFESVTRLVVEEVLSYLETNDLLQVSRLNKQWSRFIGTTPACMKKIKLRLHDDVYLTREVVLIIINSGRRYTGLSIRNREITPKIRFLAGSFQWKTIEIKDVTFVLDINLLDFIGLFEPSAVEMTFENVEALSERAVFNTNYVFPKLRSLSIIKSSRVIVRRGLNGCRTLERFILEVCHCGDNDTGAVVGSMQNLLIRCRNLKELHLGLSTPVFNMTFTEDFVELVDFQLHSLGTDKFQKTDQFFNMMAFENFCVFLLKHADTLQSITICEWIGQNIINIIFSEMIRLESVTIKDIHNYGVKEDFEFIALIQNTTITHLNIYTTTNIKKCFEWILLAVPNLRTLKMYCMSPATISFVNQHNHKLKYIQLESNVASKYLSRLNAFTSERSIDKEGKRN